MLPRPVARLLAWVSRSFHRLPGRWRLVRLLERQAQTLAGLPPRTVRFARGWRVQVSPVDENGRRVYINGFDADDRLTRHFIRLLRPGDCVLDVGANLGYYTLVAARLVGPTGCVHAFEASPAVFPWLAANAALNPKAKIRVYPVAVTDRCGQVRFYTASADRTGYSSIRDLGPRTASLTVVPSISLDSMLGILPPTRLVKIDVEGAELLVLQGMRRLIERDRPFLICELSEQYLRELGASARQQCDLLTGCGYRLYRIAAKGALQPVCDPPADQCNLLACPDGFPQGRGPVQASGR